MFGIREDLTEYFDTPQTGNKFFDLEKTPRKLGVIRKNTYEKDGVTYCRLQFATKSLRNEAIYALRDYCNIDLHAAAEGWMVDILYYPLVVMLSLKGNYVNNIDNFDKSLEIRKSLPKLDGEFVPFKVYVSAPKSLV